MLGVPKNFDEIGGRRSSRLCEGQVMVFSAGANLYIERERLKLRSEVDKLKGRWMVLEMIRRLCYPDKTPDCDYPTCAPFE